MALGDFETKVHSGHDRQLRAMKTRDERLYKGSVDLAEALSLLVEREYYELLHDNSFEMEQARARLKEAIGWVDIKRKRLQETLEGF